MEVLTKMKKIENKATNPLADTLPQRLKMCRENAAPFFGGYALPLQGKTVFLCPVRAGGHALFRQGRGAEYGRGY